MRRAGISQLTKAMMAISRAVVTCWKMVTRAMRKKRTGIESSTSTIRIMAASGQPPKKPEMAPKMTPTTVATRAEAKPTVSEVCPPYMRRPRMSKPVPSVPRGWPAPGGALVRACGVTSRACWFVWLVW